MVFKGPFVMLKTSTQKLPNVSLPDDIITLKQIFIQLCLFMNKKLIICINVLPIVYPVGGKTEWTVLKTICQCGIDPDRHTLLITLLQYYSTKFWGLAAQPSMCGEYICTDGSNIFPKPTVNYLAWAVIADKVKLAGRSGF